MEELAPLLSCGSVAKGGELPLSLVLQGLKQMRALILPLTSYSTQGKQALNLV